VDGFTASSNVGQSNLTGELTFNDEHSDRRPNYRATLRSAAFDLGDVAPLSAMISSSTGKTASADHTLPRGKLDTARLGKFDAEVDLSIAKLTARAVDLARDLQLFAELKNGIVSVKRVELVAVGGRVNGTLRTAPSQSRGCGPRQEQTVLEQVASGVLPPGSRALRMGQAQC
jgi:uncharacterized protein involved in outer membrane biogenesis